MNKLSRSLIAISALTLLIASRASAEPTISGATIDQYLITKNSPLAGQGSTFLAYGTEYKVDPRLVVAIAGQESVFATDLEEGAFNAWGWLWNKMDKHNSYFASWDEGIHSVTHFLRKSYFDVLTSMGIKPSIQAIGSIYCIVSVDPNCRFWIPNVTRFYHTDLGGDLADLGFSPATVPSSPSWIQTSGPDLTNSNATGGLVTNSFGEVFASTSRSCQDNNASGVFRSTNQGGSWSQLNFGLISTNVYSLAESNGSNLFAGTHDGTYRYDRTLATWEPSGLSGQVIAMLIATKNGLYAADSCYCSTLYQSLDEGATWQSTVGGLPVCINALVQDAAGNSFAGTGTSGVFELAAGGATWQALNAGLPTSDVHWLALDTGSNLFMGGPAGLFRRSQGAAQWMQLTNGLPSDGIQRITFGSAGMVFAGTFSHGIYLSVDGGNSWVADNSGIADPTLTVGAFATDSQGFLYAAVGSTVYRSASPIQ